MPRSLLLNFWHYKKIMIFCFLLPQTGKKIIFIASLLVRIYCRVKYFEALKRTLRKTAGEPSIVFHEDVMCWEEKEAMMPSLRLPAMPRSRPWPCCPVATPPCRACCPVALLLWVSSGHQRCHPQPWLAAGFLDHTHLWRLAIKVHPETQMVWAGKGTLGLAQVLFPGTGLRMAAVIWRLLLPAHFPESLQCSLHPAHVCDSSKAAPSNTLQHLGGHQMQQLALLLLTKHQLGCLQAMWVSAVPGELISQS